MARRLRPADAARRGSGRSLTLAGLEVSGVRCGVPVPDGLRVKSSEIGPVWDRDRIFVAEVVEVAPHPDADKLKLPTVAYGEGRTKTMVTGAPNLKVGERGVKVDQRYPVLSFSMATHRRKNSRN